jgi:hypothetical protein
MNVIVRLGHGVALRSGLLPLALGDAN